MDIGKRMKELRIQYGLTQQELADRSELTKGFISQLERNQNSPSKMTLPASGVSKPPMIRRVVVFPQPDGPRSVINSFSRIYKFKSSNTTWSP